MASDTKSQNLLYVTNTGTEVFVYSYPEGKLEGQLTGFLGPAAPCSDAAGNVFIPDASGDILEYAHGDAVPVATLHDEKFAEPHDCAIDPITGDLAVANYIGPLGTGDVVVYPKARPPYHVRVDLQGIGLYGFCSYDDAGNLFVDSANLGLPTELTEIPKDGTSNIIISLPEQRHASGGLQWDGTYLTISGPGVIYRLLIKGAVASVVGETPLAGSNGIAGYSIPKVRTRGRNPQYTRLVGPDYNGGNVRIWKYPLGGKPVKTVGLLSDPFGTTVSMALR